VVEVLGIEFFYDTYRLYVVRWYV